MNNEIMLKDGKWVPAEPVRATLFDRFVFFTYRLRQRVRLLVVEGGE